MKPGNLEGDAGGDIREYWGLRPQYLLIGPARIAPQDSQVSLSTPGLFHTLDIYTECEVRTRQTQSFPSLVRAQASTRPFQSLIMVYALLGS